MKEYCTAAKLDGQTRSLVRSWVGSQHQVRGESVVVKQYIQCDTVDLKCATCYL